jgi:hypothetical protein
MQKVNWKKICHALANEYMEEYPVLTVKMGRRGSQCKSWATFCATTLEIEHSPYRTLWRNRVMALSHELGHMLDFFYNYPDAESFDSTSMATTEWKAYLYGWGVLKRAGIEISKEQWRKFHWHMPRCYRIHIKQKGKR